MRRKLRKNQVQAFRYALHMQHPALFMEMRLGKTLVCIRRCLLYKPLNPSTGLRILVVAPSSAFRGWKKDLSFENIRYIDLRGTALQRREMLRSIKKYAESVFVLLNKEGWKAVPEIEHNHLIRWDAVIVDESTFIKNAKARVTKFFLSKFRGCPHKWILTGTPNPESDLDLWCQIAFLHEKAFGFKNFWDFRSKACYSDYSGYEWQPKPKVREIIKSELSELTFTQTRKDAGLEREKVHETRSLELPSKIRKMYDEAEKDFVLTNVNGEKAETMWKGKAWSWMRQLCGGFSNGELMWSGKINELLDLITGELSHDKIVVWFNYNAELEHIHKRLIKKKVSARKIRGSVSNRDREKTERDFEKDRFRVFLIQQKVAETGMDLSSSDTAIYYSEPPSLFTKKQTEDRILSVVKDSPLLYIHLVVEGTADEDIHRALFAKRIRSESLFRGKVWEGVKNRWI